MREVHTLNKIKLFGLFPLLLRFFAVFLDGPNKSVIKSSTSRNYIATVLYLSKRDWLNAWINFVEI